MDYLLNMSCFDVEYLMINGVLNLIINGLPSKPQGLVLGATMGAVSSFKPYYKWITF